MHSPTLIPGILIAVSFLGLGLGLGFESAANPGPASPPTRPLTAREAFVLERDCAHCHAQPEFGVPLIGDEAEWARRRMLGFEVLVAHTIDGFGNMPPLGTCGFCTEGELRRLVAFVAGYSSGVAE